MKSVLKTIFVGVLLFMSACGTSSRALTIIRPAEGTPERFAPVEGVTLDDASCKSPMVDPRDGTEIQMISAQNNTGIYRVAPGKYGVGAGEYLKLDCRTGAVLGIVGKK